MVDPLQRAALETLASRHQNFSHRRIASDYNLVAVSQGWPTLTANTVARYLEKGDVSRSVTFYAKGAKAYQQKHGIVVHRSRPSKPTYLWVHDATTYELYYQQQRGGRTTYHHRKDVCVVLDPHTWYPVGYAIGDTDNIALTQAAVKNAVAHMQELLGSYVLPYQVQSDRLGWKALGAWYEPMGVTFTPAAARNARAKVIEPYFRHHHAQYVQPYCENWSGHNIDAAVRNQPNPDALERIKKFFPNEATVIGQIHEAFARERAAKREEFVAALQGMPADTLRTINRSRFLELFGVQHDYQNELTNRGVCPTLLGQERKYNLLTEDFQQWVGTGFSTIYDPDDLSTVLVTAREGSIRYLLPDVGLVPMALMDHTPETRARLAAYERIKKELGQQAIDRRVRSSEQVRLVAGRLLERAAVPVEIIHEEPRTLAPTKEEEATVRSYVVEDGSHKKALRRASATRLSPEERAAEQL